ncbi:hypothetical protein ACWIGW_38940 [Nocardia brasiliensis]
MGELERLWVEEMLTWCATQFDERALRSPVILPTADFFPEAYSGSSQDIRKVVDTVGDYMGVSRDRVLTGDPIRWR